MTKRRMILCLGPHRTGTSAATAAIAALGADLGFSQFYANDENQKGFFEHPDLIVLNEKILAVLGGAWDSASFVGQDAIAAAGQDLAPLRAEALAFLAQHFGSADLAVLKDPRLCLLLDFWMPVLAEAGFDTIQIVHVLRDPAEAALSQQARVLRRAEYYELGRNLPEGAALWLSYMAQMWDGFDAASHLMLSYDALLDAPEASLHRLAGFVGVALDGAKATEFSAGFLDAALRHSRPAPEARAQLDADFPAARAAFDLLAPLCQREALTNADTAALRGLYDGAVRQIDQIQSIAVARLANAKRITAADMALAGDQLDLAAQALKSLRDEMATQRRDLEADRDRIIGEYEAQNTHDRLSFERDLYKARQERADALAKLDAQTKARPALIAGPMLLAGKLGRRAAQAVGIGWIRFNHLAKRSYRAIDKKSPQLAERLRAGVAPIIRAGNRAILRSDYVPAMPTQLAFAAGQKVFQFAYQRPQTIDAFRPLVTVLVPNYNHAPYLRQRLDSIYAQGWTNYEVILMDDCSTDGSVEILQEYAARYPANTRLVLNDRNSGGAFHQWEKGLLAAKGDLIWVAESDDWCAPNFLETLVPYFANEAVQLAYAPSYFMNHDGTEQVWSMAEYLAELGPERWAKPFVVAAPKIVQEAFAEKNIIPNVSSAVFRRLDRLDVLENDIWRGMRTCGDWVFYLNQIRGGLLAYSPATQNFYRQHAANTSVTSFTKDSYYAEHEAVAKCVQRHYSVDQRAFQRQLQSLELHWARHRKGQSRADFDACYSMARIMAEASLRKPKLLMAGYAFCSGGGETFPIMLANMMKTAGYDVTYLNCMQEPDIAGIRSQLARDIPVVSKLEDLPAILRDFDIDLIHSHHAWVDNTILNILPESNPAKTVITLHGMYETLPEEQLKRTLPRLVKRTSAMVYIAEKNITALVGSGLVRPDQLARIDNALPDGAGVALDRAELGIADDAFVLTVVSRAIAPKGWQEAIEAVTRAREISDKDVHLILVGDGPEYDRLLGQVPPYVRLEGFRSNTRDYFATADMGLLPSRFKGESFPLVIIDCLHAGRPVLATDLGEVRSMLQTPQGVAGAVLPVTDWQVPVEALALKIADLARNRQMLAEMAALVPLAAKRFDPVLMRDRYDAVYESVVHAQEGRQAAE